MVNDTIAAISTAAGSSARAIVRLSGPDALRILHTLTGQGECPVGPGETYRAFDAIIPLETMLLPVRVYLMRAPASYTREDVVELHTFGSPPLLRALLDRLSELSARPAGPGEFTRRAFLNGRIDLSQAEAVAALIRARDDTERRAAVRSLNGALSRQTARLRDDLTRLCAEMEAALDFSDQDIEIISADGVRARIAALRAALSALGQSERSGRVTSGALRVVLCGPPNAGKSSLFNAILRREHAIVSPHPGTTRDTVEATTRVEELDLVLVDTAGLRPPADEIESLAVTRSRQSLRQADMVLYVLDGSRPAEMETTDVLRDIEPARVMIVLNKADIGEPHPELLRALPGAVETLSLSATAGVGIGHLLRKLRGHATMGRVDRSAGAAHVSARQVSLLRRADQALARAETASLDMELIADDLREALAALTEITGGSAAEDVLDRIFADFCIGK